MYIVYTMMDLITGVLVVLKKRSDLVCVDELRNGLSEVISTVKKLAPHNPNASFPLLSLTLRYALLADEDIIWLVYAQSIFFPFFFFILDRLLLLSSAAIC